MNELFVYVQSNRPKLVFLMPEARILLSLDGESRYIHFRDEVSDVSSR